MLARQAALCKSLHSVHHFAAPLLCTSTQAAASSVAPQPRAAPPSPPPPPYCTTVLHRHVCRHGAHYTQTQPLQEVGHTDVLHQLNTTNARLGHVQDSHCLMQERWPNNSSTLNSSTKCAPKSINHLCVDANILDNSLHSYNNKNLSLTVKGPGMLGIARVSGVRLLPPRHSLQKKPVASNIISIYEEYVTNGVITRDHFLKAVTSEIANDIYRNNIYSNSIITTRFYHTTPKLWDPEPSSQVEITVNALKEKAQQKEKAQEKEKKEAEVKLTTAIDPATITTAQTAVGVADTPTTVQDASVQSLAASTVVVEKKTIWMRVKEEVVHYYHGFRLLFIDTKICTKYCYRVLNGEKLSRREHRQLVRTTGDLFRLLPFSVFLIVPFMELLLPVAIKLFPGMLPSTFETANAKEAKIKKRLKVKLEMAKFLQQTLDTMSLEGKGHSSQSVKEFVLFFEKVRRTKAQVSNEEILKFSKLFADSITLDSLSRPQLTALCQLLEMQTFGTNNFLRFQIRMKLRFLIADDKLIAVEGVESLSSWELQQACRSRGMRAYGMTDNRLRTQLKQWLELSLDQKVPQSLLLLSRTLYMSDDTADCNASLAATISQLPDEVETHTKAAIGKREGKIDNRVRLEVIQSEEKRIREDKRDLEEEQKKKKLQDVKKAGELGIGEAEVVSVGAALGGSPSILFPTPPGGPVTSEAVVAQAVKLTKATVTADGELKEKDKDELVDTAPVLVDKAPILRVDAEEKAKDTKEESEELTTEDLAEVEEALETIGVKQHRLLIEEQNLSELKLEMKDYQQDIEDFKEVIAEFPERKDLRESKAARRLFGRVNRLIAQAEPIIGQLNAKAEEMKKLVDAGEADTEHKTTLVNLEDLVTNLRQVADAPNSAKLMVIQDVLSSMDTDNDGAIKLEHIMKALDLLSEDKVGVPRKLFEEVIQAMAKEEQLETKSVLQTAMGAVKTHEEAGQGTTTAPK